MVGVGVGFWRAWPVALLALTAAAPAPERLRAPDAEAAFAAGRYGEARTLIDRALARCRPTPRQPDRCFMLLMTAANYTLAAGDAGAAERLARRAVALAQAAPDGGRAEQAMAGVSLSAALTGVGRMADAEVEARKALAVARAALGDTHVLTGSIQNSLALQLDAQGRHGEAEPLHRAAIAAVRGALGDRSPALPSLQGALAENLAGQARYREAEIAQADAVTLARDVNGPRHPAVAIALNGQAQLRMTLGDFADAERLYRDAAAINVAVLGPQHPLVGRDAASLGELYFEQGRLADAEAQFRRALAIAEAAEGPTHPAIASDLGSLAATLTQAGRPEAGEPLFRRALEIERGAFGDASPRMAAQYGALAANLEAQQRAVDAEPLRRRALDINRRTYGETHPETASTLAGLAGNLAAQARYGEARPILSQALAAQEATLGPASLAVGATLSQLGVVEARQGRLAPAEAAFRRALEIRRAALGERAPATASGHHNLASVLELAGRLDAAELPARQALAIRREVLPDGHPEIAVSEALLARILAARPGDEALEHARAGMTLVRARRLQSMAGGGAAARAELRARSAQPARDPVDRVFSAFLYAAAQAPQPEALAGEAFVAAQDLDVSAAGLAMAQTAARTAAGAGDLAALARRQQDLSTSLRALDARAVQALGQGLPDKATALRRELDETGHALAAVERDLRSRYPGYADLVAPRPLSLDHVRARLGPREGLLLVTPADDDLYVFAVTRRRVAWRRLAGAAPGVRDQVAALRCSVDPATCGVGRLAKPFDTEVAHALYRQVVQPVEPALAGAQRLFVTAGGPVAALPLDALVTAASRDPTDLARTRWLGDRYAMISLPSVSALTARRTTAPGPEVTAFVGYGDPTFAGGGAGDMKALRAMPPLPGTRQELQALAQVLNAPPDSLVLGAAATETSVRADPRLNRARVVAFATHGLLPGELNGHNEPALVFTPPVSGSPNDDGLLSASEVAQMSLAAEWVVLSACNTGSGEGGSDSLSALARAFLYAGARSLVASHWRVADDATAALTVEMLATRRAHPRLSQAEARQRAMRAVRTGRRADGSAVAGWTPEWRDPAAWAPFTLIAASND